MRKRLPYLISAAVLLLAELFIGFFVDDTFVRPYGGDILVTILPCCCFRCLFPDRWKWMPVGVWIFSVGVEFFQLIVGPYLQGTLLGIILGSSFSWLDILCYALGCALFAATERLFKD